MKLVLVDELLQSARFHPAGLHVFNRQLAEAAYSLAAGLAGHTVRRKGLLEIRGLGNLRIIGAVPVNVGNDRAAIFEGESACLAYFVDNVFGAGDIQFTLGLHKIELRINIPEYCVFFHNGLSCRSLAITLRFFGEIKLD